MRKIKRFALVIMTVLMTCLCVIGLSACDLLNRGDRNGADNESSVGNATTSGVCDHVWNQIDYTAPSCTEAGKIVQECTTCHEKSTKTLSALGHKTYKLEAKAATCTESGLTEGEKCGVCGDVTIEQTTIDAKGHNTIKEATCQNKAECSVCGEYGEKLTDHDPWLIIAGAKKATCTEDGWNEYTWCRGCTYSTKEVITATGHDAEHEASTEATCTALASCGVCGESYGEFAEHVKDETVTSPQCEGARDVCSVCNRPFGEFPESLHVLSVDGEELDKDKSVCSLPVGAEIKCLACDELIEVATGHHFVEVATVAPTCYTEGVRAYKVCSDCGEMRSVEDTTAGVPGDALIVDGMIKVDPEDELKDISLTIEPLKHHNILQVISGKAPTCTEAGYTRQVYCGTCNVVFEKSQFLSMLGHDGARTDIWVEEAVPTATVYYNDWVIGDASAAGGRLVKITDDMLNENGFCKDDSEALNCMQQAHCGFCGIDHGDIGSGAHYGGSIVCTEDAICTLCGDVYREAGEHVEIVLEGQAASCMAGGYTDGKICTVCGFVTEQRELIAMLDHDQEGIIEAIAPTEDAPGYTEGRYCSMCEKYVTVAPVEIPAIHEHTYDENGDCTYENCNVRDHEHEYGEEGVCNVYEYCYDKKEEEE